jgi:hypothetical protein
MPSSHQKTTFAADHRDDARGLVLKIAEAPAPSYYSGRTVSRYIASLLHCRVHEMHQRMSFASCGAFHASYKEKARYRELDIAFFQRLLPSEIQLGTTIVISTIIFSAG